MKNLLIALLVVFSTQAFSQSKLVPQKITLKSGKSFSLNVAEGFAVTPAVEGLKRVRFFAKSPDGRIFVTDMYNLTDNKRGVIYILDGWNETTGKFARVIPYLTGLHNPNSVQFYVDAAGQNWIYIAETEKLTRRKFTLGETKPTDNNPQTLATFPDYGLSYKYGGWHLTRTIAFGSNGKLYVSVGSSCNSCVEKESVRASVIEMNPDGSDQHQIAKGLRNAVGLKWIIDALYATNQGSDHLGTEKPDETFYKLAERAETRLLGSPPQHLRAGWWPSGSVPSSSGTNVLDRSIRDYGWPYCHSSNGKVFADPILKRPEGCRNVIAPFAFFPARSSALGFDYFGGDSPAPIRNAFLVSLHGSTNKRIGHGYRVVIMRPGQKLQDLITGFLQNGQVVGRPCDILRLDANSFLFTDDNKGNVYLVRKRS
jgi:glucose/arabinose dehydrogenase